MKVLVTGCAGFIGSNLTDYLLKNGFNVVGIDCFMDYYPQKLKKSNIKDALKHSNFSFIEKDLFEINKYPRDVDYIFHLAAQAGVRASWGESFQIYTKNNVEVTQKLLEFYKNCPIRKFIYSSSSSVYGDSNIPMNESSLLKPVSPYGVTKLAAENLCYLYWKNYNVPTISLRYFTVYGPRQRPDMAINKFVKAVFNNETIKIYGDGEQTRDFTYIDDVVKALILSAKTEVVGEVFNVGGGSQISVNDLIIEIENQIGIKAEIKHEIKQKGDVKNTCADLSKVRNLLGWNPKVDIRNGIKKYVEWYINQSLDVF